MRSHIDDFPDNLLTCFCIAQLPIYKEAVELYKISNSEVELVINTGPNNNVLGDPALYIMTNRQDLTEFWQLFEQVKQQATFPE